MRPQRLPTSGSALRPQQISSEAIGIHDPVDEVRAGPARVAVLLNRVVGGARSGPDARAALTELGYEILGPQIPRREDYALAYGAEPDIRGGDPFDLLAETYLKRAAL